MEDVGPGDIWHHDGVLTPGPGAAGHAVHQAGDERAVEPEEDGSGDHVPVSAVEYDEAISVFTHLQCDLEKSIIPFKPHSFLSKFLVKVKQEVGYGCFL